jgi:S1-C subfamily serine protease
LTENTNGVLVGWRDAWWSCSSRGIKPRDRILKINQQNVSSAAQLIAVVGQIKPNTVADVLIKRVIKMCYCQ